MSLRTSNLERGVAYRIDFRKVEGYEREKPIERGYLSTVERDPFRVTIIDAATGALRILYPESLARATARVLPDSPTKREWWRYYASDLQPKWMGTVVAE